MNKCDNLLFYSHKCPYSLKCLELIQPYAEQITFLGYINIHRSRDSLPLRIRRVPSLVLNNGENVLEGRDVYLWIQELIDFIDNQNTQCVEKEKEEQEQEVEIKNDKCIQNVWSSSTIITPDDGELYCSVNNMCTFSDTIDYGNIKQIEAEDEKISVSVDALETRRNTDLEKIWPRQTK